jgi:hypothetical protein
MTDRQFRLLLGIALLVLLYLDSVTGMGVLIAYLVFEGVTNWRIPLLTSRFFPGRDGDSSGVEALNISAPVRIPFEAERALRLMLALILSLSVYAYPEQLWWMSWFIAFAVIGAGISDICPMLTSLRLLGFR